MPRAPDPVDGVYNYMTIDNTVLFKYPIRSTWNRQQIGRRGDREARFAVYMSVVHEFGICTEREHNQLHDFWMEGGLHTVVMASPDLGYSTEYTGVAIDDVTANRVDWYYENVRMVLSGILIPSASLIPPP